MFNEPPRKTAGQFETGLTNRLRPLLSFQHNKHEGGCFLITFFEVPNQVSRCNVTVETSPVSTVPGYVVYHQTRDVSGQSLFSSPTCMLVFSTSLSAPIRQQPEHLT